MLLTHLAVYAWTGKLLIKSMHDRNILGAITDIIEHLPSLRDIYRHYRNMTVNTANKKIKNWVSYRHYGTR